MMAIIFGSSRGLSDSFWRVWTYHEDDGSVSPLAEFQDKSHSDTAAFDLAHSAAHLENPDGMQEILSRGNPPTCLSSKTAEMFTTLAQNAIRDSTPARQGKAFVSISTTDFDRVHVVRFPED